MSVAANASNSVKRHVVRSRSSSRERLGRKTPRLERLTPQRVPRSTSSHACGTRNSAAGVKRSVSASALTPSRSQPATCFRDKAVARRKEAEIQNFCMTVGGPLDHPLVFPLSSGQFKAVFTMMVRMFDPTFKDLPQPFDKLMPQLMWDLGFAPNEKLVSRQTFQTLGTPFSWPIALATLAHVMEIAKFTTSLDTIQLEDLAFQDDPTGNIEFDFFVNSYKTFNAKEEGFDGDFKQQLEFFEHNLSRGNDANYVQQELDQIKQTVALLESQVVTLRSKYDDLSVTSDELRGDMKKILRYNEGTREYQKDKKEQTVQALEYIKHRQQYEYSLDEEIARLQQESQGVNEDIVKAEVCQIKEGIIRCGDNGRLLDQKKSEFTQRVEEKSAVLKGMKNRFIKLVFQCMELVKHYGKIDEVQNLADVNVKEDEIIATLLLVLKSIEKANATKFEALDVKVCAMKKDLSEAEMSKDQFIQLLATRSDDHVQKTQERADKKKELKGSLANIKAQVLAMEVSYPELEEKEQQLHHLKIKVEGSRVQTEEQETKLKELLLTTSQRLASKRNEQLAILEEHLKEYQKSASRKIAATRAVTQQFKGLSDLLPRPPHTTRRIKRRSTN